MRRRWTAPLRRDSVSGDTMMKMMVTGWGRTDLFPLWMARASTTHLLTRRVNATSLHHLTQFNPRLFITWNLITMTSLWSCPKPHTLSRVLHHNSEESRKLGEGFPSPQPPIGSRDGPRVPEILVGGVSLQDVLTELLSFCDKYDTWC